MNNKQALMNAMGLPLWGPTGRDVYERTYSRTKKDGTKENWEETIERVIDGNLSLVDKQYHEKGEKEKLLRLFRGFNAIPAGRHLWASGVEGRTFLNNCFRAGWDAEPVSHFTFLFARLMEGGGVGANYSDRYIKHYWKVKRPFSLKLVCNSTHPDYDDMRQYLSTTISERWSESTRIEDSREGWVEAVDQLLSLAFDSSPSDTTEIIFDVSNVRPRGAPVKTFGGTASGPTPLCQTLTNIASHLNSMVGQRPTSLDMMLIDHYLAEVVVSGGIRRSSRMSIKHWKDDDIFDFISCKKDSKHHWTTNISVEVDNAFLRALKKGEKHAKRVYDAIVRGMLTNGEPGVFNSSKASEGELEDVCSTNPCVTGDTMVAVADGRGAVSIKDLADVGEDIPVYTRTDRGAVTIRTMRHPRKTGTDVQVLKVTLDDGSTVRVTPNHRFVLSDGSHREAKNIQTGDSLCVMTRFSSNLDNIIDRVDTKNKTDYWWLRTNTGFVRSEHRMIAEHYAGRSKKSNEVIHHKNHNSLDNTPQNLEFVDRDEHNRYHSERMKSVSGEKNGRAYTHITNDDIRERVLEETAKVGRKLSTKEWTKICKTNGFPLLLTKWRRTHLGRYSGLLRWAAVECGFEDTADLDPRTVRSYHKFLQQGYDCEIINERVMFNKVCEQCNTPFQTYRRESAVCSYTCVNSKAHSNPVLKAERMRKVERTARAEHGNKRIAQVDVFNDLKFSLGREPMKKEWKAACRTKGIVIENGRKSSPFTSWNALKDAARSRNHRVVSVEDAGYNDVYNGTVDEFHNFYSECESSRSISKSIFFNHLQCGEIALENSGPCCLGHVNLDSYHDDHEGCKEAHRLMCRFLVRSTFGDHPDEGLQEAVRRNRRIGVGHFGFQGWCVKQGIRFSDAHMEPDIRRKLREYYDVVRKEARKYAFQLRIPEPIKVTTEAPTGSIAKLPGVSEGIHPIYSRYFNRRVRYSRVDPDQMDTVEKRRAEGYHVEDCQYASLTLVVTYPTKDKLVKEVEDIGLDAEHLVESADEISVTDMLSVQAMVQEEYADNAISFTINVQPGAESVRSVKETLVHYLPKLKGTTMMVDGSRPQAPYERITPEEYESSVGKMVSDGIDEECANGACPVK